MSEPRLPVECTEPLWTCAEVAAFLRCTPRHVHNLQRSGLPHLYLGSLLRFDPTEVRAYLLKHRRVDGSHRKPAAR
jgi:hypothetical protein